MSDPDVEMVRELLEREAAKEDEEYDYETELALAEGIGHPGLVERPAADALAALDRISSRLAELERLRAEAEDECARLGFVIARLRTALEGTEA